MQEQIDKESIAITVKAAKLTAKTLAAALRKAIHSIKQRRAKAQSSPSHGKQSVKQLMKDNVSTSTIPIEGDKGLFDRVARKYHVDYAFYKTEPNKYLLFFKSGQADAITAAFSEYSALVMKRMKDKRPRVKDELKKAAERAEREQPKRRRRELEREVTNVDR